MDANEIMTVREVAEYLQVHEMTVYRWFKAGTIPGFKLGGRWRSIRSKLNGQLDKKARVQSAC